MEIIKKDGFTVKQLISELKKLDPKAHLYALGKSDVICIIEICGDEVALGDSRDL